MIRAIFGYILAILGVVLVAGVFGGAYFFIIAPQLIEKPDIPLPDLAADIRAQIAQGQKVIQQDHLNYLANEIGAFKLKQELIGEADPEIEFTLTDTAEIFYTTVKDHIPETKPGPAPNPDLRIKGSQLVVVTMLKSGSVQASIREQLDLGTIKVKTISDTTTLAKKGFLALYETIK